MVGKYTEFTFDLVQISEYHSCLEKKAASRLPYLLSCGRDRPSARGRVPALLQWRSAVKQPLQ